MFPGYSVPFFGDLIMCEYCVFDFIWPQLLGTNLQCAGAPKDQQSPHVSSLLKRTKKGYQHERLVNNRKANCHQPHILYQLIPQEKEENEKGKAHFYRGL